MSKKNLSEELKQQIVNEWINGKKTIAQLAKEHGCSEQSIRNWAKKNIIDTSVCDKTSSQLGVDIPANRVSESIVYSLTAAAVEIKVNKKQLIHYAILGKISIYAENTDCYYLIDRVQLDDLAQYYNPKNWMNWSDSPRRDYKNSCTVPLLLSLELSDYQEIYHYGAINKSKFSRISTKEYVIDGEKKEQILKWKKPQPIDVLEHFGNGNFFYPFIEKDIPTLDSESYKGDRVRKIRIDFDRLRVLSEDLKYLVEQELNIIHQQQSQEIFQNHDNKSSLLVDLDKAAFDFYGVFNPIKAAHYDTIEKISTYLMERFGFFKIHADVAAEVILPSSNNTIKDDNQSEYRPRLLQLLIQAWNELCINKEFKKDDEIKYDCDADNWFNDNFKHKLNLSYKNRMILAKIILPDNASFHNPRRAKK